MGLAKRAQQALYEEAVARNDRHRQAWLAAKEAKQRWRSEMLTAELTAESLAISVRTLRRWTAEGRLTCVRLGDFDQSPIRYRRAEVEALKQTIRESSPVSRAGRREVSAFPSGESRRDANARPDRREGGRQHGR